MHVVITWFSEAQTWRLEACDVGPLFQMSCFCSPDGLYGLELHERCDSKSFSDLLS